jgi:hypothetical protein
MRPILTGSMAIVVGAVAVFGSPCLAAAQHAPADPLAVRLPDDATGTDVELIVSMAARLGVPLGFEAADALQERVSMPFSPHPGNPGPSRAKPLISVRQRPRDGGPRPFSRVRPRPLDVRGVTLRQALDAAVAADGRYEWRDVDGVVVVRPRAAWRDPEHPLLRRVTATQRDDAGVPMDFDGSLLDLLNTAVRAPGRLQWSLRSEVSTVFLDGGRAVTVSQPVLSFGGPAGSSAIPLR